MIQNNSLKKSSNENLAANINSAPIKKAKIENNIWKGIFWKTISCLAFALLNTLVRYLTGGAGGVENALTPSQLTFLQNVIGCLFLIPWLLQNRGQGFKTNDLTRHSIRILAGVSGIIMLYSAFL